MTRHDGDATRPRHASRRFGLFAGLIAVLFTTFLLRDRAGVSSPGDGAIGIPTTRPEGTGRVLVSPAGRRVPYGTLDPLGYRLPLDVAKPGEKPGKSVTPRTPPIVLPDRDAGESRGVPLFDEHRLGPDDGHTQNETSIAVDGTTLIAGWNQYVDSGLVMGVGRSVDGGDTWTSTAFTEHDVTSDPALRAGGSGVWYYAYLASGGPFGGGGDIDIWVRRSLDDGATWQAPVDATQNTSFDDKPYIDARGDEVLVGWADFAFSPAKVRTVRSLDGGLTFSPAVTLANSSVGGNGACPVIGPEGTYYMFWRDSFQDSLWISRSDDQGTTWSPDRGIVPMSPLPSSLPGGFRIVNLPSAVADPLTGDLLVVWNDQALGDPDILAIRSQDAGETWSAPVRVNDDPAGAAQFFPWVTFDAAGVAYCVWYDRREDGFDIDVYLARSLDGGTTWDDNVRVTASAFTPVLPNDTSVDFVGDYNGITAAGGIAYPFYQDARRGEQDVYVALVPVDLVAAPPVAPPAVRSRLHASPSPFERTTSFSLDGASDLGARATLVIFDATGRLVRRLPGTIEQVWRWDGLRADGTAAPAGVYHARVVGRGEGARVVKVR